MSSAKSAIPDKYDPASVEPKWRKFWEDKGIYRWDSSKGRKETFVVDTPPPTVSGSLHVGHVFSYTQTDTIVRYQRMRGKNIFYPMGWDDNGLPTERRVQNFFGIRCDPHLSYEPNWKPDATRADKEKNVQQVSRRNFIEACDILTKEDELAFQRLWSTLGLSVDWSLEYATIDEHCRRISQLSFLDLVKKEQVYHSVAPTMWDTSFQSAISQAEIEDREIGGAFHDIKFGVEGGGEFTISTTRPELLAACIAVVAHPEDKRYQHLFGKQAITPLFYSRVPICPAAHADPEKGTGILMVCTFGDIMDVQWWKESKLPVKQIIGLDGKILPINHGSEPFNTLNAERANFHQNEIKGLYVKPARKKIAELLSAVGSSADGNGTALVGEPKQIMHPVKFYEKGDQPLEFIPTRQWFQKIMEHKDALLAQGSKVRWHPAHMQTRYEHWVQGLNQDWCLSRQRYFGVPFPVWYPIDAAGKVQHAKPIYASAEKLPVDPLADVAPGYKAEQRDKAGGFCGEADVMDTWATSALTPQIATHWLLDPERHAKLFPMDLRPQAHDIIRTWAFVSIVRAWAHEKQIPWTDAAISGFIMDPDRKKMSKSKGNVITPEGLLHSYSADAVRYWAARARLGIDTAFDDKLFAIGRKLTTKIFNASRFVLMQFQRINAGLDQFSLNDISVPLDCALIDRMRELINSATRNMDEFDYAIALQSTEENFWNFCDHYLELVKVRTYSEEDNAGRRSGYAALAWTLKTFLRLFAPFVPYATEEVWSWTFSSGKESESIHTATWPSLSEINTVKKPENPKSLEAAIEILGLVRGAKTGAQKSLKWEVSKLEIKCSKEFKAALMPVLDDTLKAGNVPSSALKINESTNGEALQVNVELAENWEPKHAGDAS